MCLTCVGWTKKVGVAGGPLSLEDDKAIVGQVTLWGTEGPRA